MTTIAAEVSIDRSSLSLSPLVIRNDEFGPDALWIADIGPVNFDYRRRYAPDSDDVAGSVLLTAVKEASAIPLVIYCRDTTTAANLAKQAELEAALAQFLFEVTVTIDGSAVTYTGERCAPIWSWSADMAEAHLARGSVVIPVNPPGA